MDLEKRVLNEIDELKSIAKKYEELNKNTNGKYHWRTMAIYENIAALNYMLEGASISEEWIKCYEEDKEG